MKDMEKVKRERNYCLQLLYFKNPLKIRLDSHNVIYPLFQLYIFVSSISLISCIEVDRQLSTNPSPRINNAHSKTGFNTPTKFIVNSTKELPIGTLTNTTTTPTHPIEETNKFRNLKLLMKNQPLSSVPVPQALPRQIYEVPNNNDKKRLTPTGMVNPTESSQLVSLQSTSNPYNNTTTLNPECETSKLTERCAKLLPPDLTGGIPASHQAVEKACQVFPNTLKCHHDWAKKCIKPERMQKFNEMVSGANEVYEFLCKDHIFREDFLRHSECYKKISPRLDDCADRFLKVLQSFNKEEKSNDFCCLRYAFIKCVMQITNHKCDKKAASMIQKIAETLIRSKTNNNKKECVTNPPSGCPEALKSHSNAGPNLVKKLVNSIFVSIIILYLNNKSS